MTIFQVNLSEPAALCFSFATCSRSMHPVSTYQTSHITFSYIPSIPSVLWCCWFGGRKGIQPVKHWVVGCWHGYLSGVRCRFAYGPTDATATHYLLFQWIQIGFTRMVLHFWCRLTQVVLEKRPLNKCSCSSSSIHHIKSSSGISSSTSTRYPFHWACAMRRPFIAQI